MESFPEIFTNFLRIFGGVARRPQCSRSPGACRTRSVWQLNVPVHVCVHSGDVFGF